MQRRYRLVPKQSVSVNPQTAPANKVSPLVRANRSRPRDAALLDAVSRLDTFTDPETLYALHEWLRERYEERQGGNLVGLFAACHLGRPYVDHQINLAGTIAQHFTATDSVPPDFSAARALARSAAYAYIEVYEDGAVIPIRPDGTSAA